MWDEGDVESCGVRFHVRRLGPTDAPAALLLHGWPEDGSAWRRVAPLLVEAGWQVVCPDLKGMGASERARSGHDPDTLAHEMVGILDAIGIERPLVVGHDWGGVVGLALALRRPERVRGLVVVSAPYRQIDLRRSLHIPLFNLPVVPELLFRVAARPVLGAAVRYSAAEPEAFPDEVLDAYAAQVADHPGAWLEYYRSLSRRVVIDWARRRVARAVRGRPSASGGPVIAVPVHVVWGEQDPATPAHLAPRVAYDLGGSLTVLPGVGHFPPEEHPRALAREIVQFATTSENRTDGEVVRLHTA